MELGPGEIALWLLDIRQLQESKINSLEPLLSEVERAQSNVFLFKKDRHRFILTRAMIRTLLGLYLELNPRYISFEYNQFGRPFVSPQQNIAGLDFNISHSGNLIVAAFFANGQIGVDVENLYKKRRLEVAKDFFSPAEVKELFQQPKEKQLNHFLNFWTLKEAYIKAKGMGLTLPLHTFGFCLRDSAVQFCDYTGEQAADDWLFQILQYAEEYQLALAAKPIKNENNIILHHYSANELLYS